MKNSIKTENKKNIKYTTNEINKTNEINETIQTNNKETNQTNGNKININKISINEISRKNKTNKTTATNSMSMELVDVHAHLTDSVFSDLEGVLSRAKEHNVNKVITAGYDFLSSQNSVELSKKNSQVYATVGIHPENIEDFDENSIKNLEKLAKTSKKVVAIGEIGLDYHFFDGLTKEEIQAKKDIQKEVFIKQIDLANKLELPIVVHCRDAMGDVLEILKNHPLKKESLMHCFSGSYESAEILIKLNFSFSFGGVTTFKNAKNLQTLIPKLSLSKILLETDCPYLTPEPFRGKRNEPKNVIYVADKIANLKGTTLEDVAFITTQNAERIFSMS